MPERRLQPDLAQWIVQALTRLLATYSLIQGAGIILGGPDRWQGKGLAVAMSVPGAPASWGWALTTLGVICLTATFKPAARTVALSLAGIGAWSFFFAITLAVTTAQTPTVATTGAPTYTLAAIIAGVLAVPYWKSRQ